jgi:hypothetical protein
MYPKAIIAANQVQATQIARELGLPGGARISPEWLVIVIGDTRMLLGRRFSLVLITESAQVEAMYGSENIKNWLSRDLPTRVVAGGRIVRV